MDLCILLQQKVLSPFQYSVFAFKPILFCTMVLLFLALLLWGNQTSKKDLYWLIYLLGILSVTILYVYNLKKTNWYLAIVNVAFQLFLSAVCATLLNNIDFAYYKENLL
jgi:hypothetical protein